MKTKKVITIIIILITLIIICILLLLGFAYKDFFKERAAMKVEINNNNTKVLNSSFDFTFEINQKCHIDSDIKNHLANGLWGGYLICEDNQEPVDLFIWNYTVYELEDLNQYNGNQRIYGGELGYENFRMVIVGPANDKVFIIRGNRYNKDIWHDITDSIKEEQ